MREFRILGPLEVVDGQRVVPLGGRRQRALLAILLVARREVLSSHRLIDLLWAEAPPATAAKTLQVYISHLRAALGNETIVTRGNGYQLMAPADEVDAERFEALARDGRRALDAGDAIAAQDLLASALALWRGDALADFSAEAFAIGEVRRLEQSRFVALEDRIDADLALGRHRDLIGELEALVAAHPLRERLRGQLMTALYRCDRQADALQVYRDGRRALDDELGLEPSHVLQTLEQRILAQDPSLDAPPPMPPTVSVGVSAEPPGRRSRHTRSALIGMGGAVLLAAAVAAAVVELAGAHATALRPMPNSVVAIDTTTNRVSAQVSVGSRPGGITFGSGSMWVANRDDHTVSRVDPATLATLRTLPVGAPPTGITATANRVWIVTSGASPAVEVDRIDPQFDTVKRTARLTNLVPGSPAEIAAHGRSLWVAPSSGLLTRLNPRTGRAINKLDPNNSPAGIAVGAGAVWTTDNQADNVTQVDSTGLTSSAAVGHGPSGIAIDSSAIWVADTGDDTVVRIDPTTRAVTATIPVGHLPLGIAVGAGSVWVANSGDGTVDRIDPSDDRVITTIRVGGSPQDVAIAADRAWVTIDAQTVPSGGAATPPGEVRLDSDIDLDSMDPALAYERLSWQLLYETCAKLVNYPDQAGRDGSRLVPEVAQALPARTTNGRTYTFTIRSGYRFSPPSDQPVTAQTFRSTIERTLNPRMHSPVADQLNDIVGVRAYRAGRAAHISGVTARSNTLTIRLLRPEPDLLSRLAEPFFCAVPPNTPVDPAGVRVIPSAGPYQVASYVPGQGVTLTRNPNYHGARPRRPARIDLTVGVSQQQAVKQVEAGATDLLAGDVPPDAAPALSAKYGPNSPAAKAGRQQYFVTPLPALDFLALNTTRPLFAQQRLRRAVNYAIDRNALAGHGSDFSSLPETPTDLYIPPGIQGYSTTRVYPLRPDLPNARRLVRGRHHRTAVLYTCNLSPCAQHAQIIKNDLAAIGIHVTVEEFSTGVLYAKIARPGEPFDIADVGWAADYLDPDDFMNFLIDTNTLIPRFSGAATRRELEHAGRLTGETRYLTYSRLDVSIARHAAPLVAYGDASSHDLLSARIGCQTFGPYGVDLGALCIR